MAVVAQLGMASDYSVDARDGAQIRVNGQQVVVRHALIIGPRHDLEKIPINPCRGRNAVCSYTGGAVLMQMIKILASPVDLTKLLKRVAAFMPPGFVWCHGARYKVPCRRRRYRTAV